MFKNNCCALQMLAAAQRTIYFGNRKFVDVVILRSRMSVLHGVNDQSRSVLGFSNVSGVHQCLFSFRSSEEMLQSASSDVEFSTSILVNRYITWVSVKAMQVEICRRRAGERYQVWHIPELRHILFSWARRLFS